MPRKRDHNDESGGGSADWEESPSGEHRRPLGSNEAWRDTTDPRADARAVWWARPVTLPWGALLAVAGVGAGGTGATMVSNLLIPDEVVTEIELAAQVDHIEAAEQARQLETDRKLDGISRDIADLHDDVDSLTEILDRAFPRFPTERRTP